ncbi:cytoplasmic protein [Cryptococcus deuterogattii 2001/935-1]|nr:cytoplasmic protein [Cryptococcus deuterogattii 2001/935-1]
MQAYLASRPAYHRTHPRMFDTECLHTPYLPPPTPGPHGISSLSAHRNSPRLKPASGAGHVPEGDLLNLGNDYSFGTAAAHNKRATSPSRSSNQNQNQNQNPSPNELKRRPGFSKRPGSGRKKSASGSTTTKDNTAADGMTDSEREEDDDLEEEWIPDVFLFEYGCVVLWGMTEKEEKKFLASIKRFEIERLSAEDVEMEDLNFYYADYSRTKLSLSHALSQSVKISLFEELIMGTIEQTKDIPKSLSETGKIGLPRSEIMKQIGNLFILRININLVGSILDSPEFFWTFPDLEPLYNAARSYLEIGQRVELLNARVDVLQDMLKLLKESVNSSHGERLEAIVIFLIGIEIVLGIITILVDLSFS